jgi:hypothetical protein
MQYTHTIFEKIKGVLFRHRHPQIFTTKVGDSYGKGINGHIKLQSKK